MAMKRLFKSSLLSCQFFFSDGTRATFISGRYATDSSQEIKELEKEIKLGHPHIFIDSEEKEVDAENLSPLEIIKKKAIQEYLETQKAREGTDFGKSDQKSGAGTGTATSKETAGIDVSELFKQAPETAKQ